MRTILSAVLAWGMFGSFAYAQTHDSSADAAAGFVDKVEKSKGVILRVPMNEKGEVNVGKAEMRLHVNGSKIDKAQDLVNAWKASDTIANQPSVNNGETIDSSTHGWWRYNYYRNYWAPSYYYFSYIPTYYYFGSAYRYNYGYTYPYYGYRYYYYYW